jgi:putative aldouronate transport system substrate-binding protein
MPWIRDNNLTVPRTLDEFTEYLRYVKTHDLNKNGRQDEIPAAFYADQMLNFVSYIAKAFLPFTYGTYDDGVVVENGKLVEQYRDPRFRDALKYLAGIYREGLILPDSFTMSQNEFQTLAESPDQVLAVEGMTWLFWSTTHPSIRSSEKFVFPPLEGPQGQRNGSNISPWSTFYPGFIVTDKCNDPALAVALYDYLISFENEMDGYLGPKGQAWAEADPGALSIMGTQASHYTIWAFGNVPVVNASWGQANPMIRNKQFRNGETADGMEIIRQWYETGDPSLQAQVVALPAFAGEGMWYTVTEKNAQYAMPDSLFVPPMALSDEDDARITDINVMLNSYKQQAIAEFITGIRNINSDADWNTYLADLDRLGSAEMVQIRQKYIR